jgi:hypothetical protein
VYKEEMLTIVPLINFVDKFVGREVASKYWSQFPYLLLPLQPISSFLSHRTENAKKEGTPGTNSST